MGRVLIIGAGGVGTVVAHKVAQNADVFTDIMIASRTKEKCDKIVEAIGNPNIKTAKVDADNVEELVALFNNFKPEMVINVALPYQDLTIMEACLKAGVNYLDTANYEPKDEAHFEYSWQWAYHDRFKEAGLTPILGCGFDPISVLEPRISLSIFCASLLRFFSAILSVTFFLTLSFSVVFAVSFFLSTVPAL